MISYLVVGYSMHQRYEGSFLLFYTHLNAQTII